MKASLHFIIEAADEAEIARIREEMADHLDVPVIAASSAIEEPEWQGYGSIRGQPDEHWEGTVRAADEVKAKAEFLKANPQRTVVKVLPA